MTDLISGHWIQWEEPDVWEVCGDIFWQDWEWYRFFGDDFETLVSCGWLLEVMPCELDIGQNPWLLIWGTDHSYAEPMGLIGGPDTYYRDLNGNIHPGPQ